MLRSTVRLIACLALCLAIAVWGGLVTEMQVSTWYAGLAKPSWTPPNVVFPVAWTILYILIAAALWRLWDRAPQSRERRWALRFFLVQLALNAAWSPVFFGLQAITLGLVIIIALLVALLPAVFMAMRADRLSGLLLLPYLLWIAYATTLNAAIRVLN
jgi:benzodiazapine receptor